MEIRTLNRNNIIIRQEKSDDYKKTEYMTLRAFWNIHGPGCSEHYLVHLLREEIASEKLFEVSTCFKIAVPNPISYKA